jgi:hypothetical protein
MLGHFPMRFVFYPLDLSPVFNPANNAPEVNDSADCRVTIVLWRFKQRLGQ